MVYIYRISYCIVMCISHAIVYTVFVYCGLRLEYRTQIHGYCFVMSRCYVKKNVCIQYTAAGLSFPASLPFSFPHSLTPSLPPSLNPSLPPLLLPSLPHSLTPCLPPSIPPSLSLCSLKNTCITGCVCFCWKIIKDKFLTGCMPKLMCMDGRMF